jgi:hypothetical protein
VVHDHYGSLEDIGISGDEVAGLMEKIVMLYYNEFADIEKDLRKSRPLDVI